MALQAAAKVYSVVLLAEKAWEKHVRGHVEAGQVIHLTEKEAMA